VAARSVRDWVVCCWVEDDIFVERSLDGGARFCGVIDGRISWGFG